MEIEQAVGALLAGALEKVRAKDKKRGSEWKKLTLEQILEVMDAKIKKMKAIGTTVCIMMEDDCYDLAAWDAMALDKIKALQQKNQAK